VHNVWKTLATVGIAVALAIGGGIGMANAAPTQIQPTQIGPDPEPLDSFEEPLDPFEEPMDTFLEPQEQHETQEQHEPFELLDGLEPLELLEGP
jgi:hypothetical protein